MRRCYRGAALVLGGILITGFTSLNSCSFGTLTVYAAEDTLSEEMEVAFQEEVQTGEEYVETDIPTEEAAAEPIMAAGNSFSLEEQEYQLLLKIVEAEAGGEDATGKMLVANVVMNRVRSGHFPIPYQRLFTRRMREKHSFLPQWMEDSMR